MFTLSQVWLVGALSSQFWVFLTCYHHSLSASSLSGLMGSFRLTLYFPRIGLGISHFLYGVLVLVLGKVHLETKIYASGVLTRIGGHTLFLNIKHHEFTSFWKFYHGLWNRGPLLNYSF